MSLLTVCCTFALCTSTIGVSPVTVIVSSSAPTFRSPFTVATNVPGQLDAFALDGAEARQRERHRVGARPQVDDPVLAGVVADDRADFFNQHRAGGFDRHTRQHAARRVLDDAGNGGLRIGRRRQEQRADQQTATAESLQNLNIALLLTDVHGTTSMIAAADNRTARTLRGSRRV